MRKQRVFEKDGDRRKTAVPAVAVALLARGYEEVLEESPYEPGGVLPTAARRRTPPPARPPSDERNNAPD